MFEALRKIGFKLKKYVKEVHAMAITVVPVRNTKRIRLAKSLLKNIYIKDKVEVEEKIMLKSFKTSIRAGWKEAFSQMHERGEDVLEDIPEPVNFDWEW